MSDPIESMVNRLHGRLDEMKEAGELKPPFMWAVRPGATQAWLMDRFKRAVDGMEEKERDELKAELKQYLADNNMEERDFIEMMATRLTKELVHRMFPDTPDEQWIEVDQEIEDADVEAVEEKPPLIDWW